MVLAVQLTAHGGHGDRGPGSGRRRGRLGGGAGVVAQAVRLLSSRSQVRWSLRARARLAMSRAKTPTDRTCILSYSSEFPELNIMYASFSGYFAYLVWR